MIYVLTQEVGEYSGKEFNVVQVNSNPESLLELIIYRVFNIKQDFFECTSEGYKVIPEYIGKSTYINLDRRLREIFKFVEPKKPIALYHSSLREYCSTIALRHISPDYYQYKIYIIKPFDLRSEPLINCDNHEYYTFDYNRDTEIFECLAITQTVLDGSFRYEYDYLTCPMLQRLNQLWKEYLDNPPIDGTENR